MGVISQQIDHYLRQQQMQNNRVMRNKLHPSTIGMCDRRIVFDMLMVPIPIPDPRILKVYDNGHFMHKRYQNYFLQIGLLIQAELHLKKGDISGHSDALINLYSLQYPNGEQRLIELKSASDKSFKWMVKNNRPKKEHYEQLNFYMHLSGIHKGTIFVENKDTQETWEYDMVYNPELGKKQEAKALRLIQSAKERKLPDIPPTYTPSCYKCSICSYNFYCYYGHRKKDGSERYPIPFQFGSKAYKDTLSIIYAIQNNTTIPNVIEGDTLGDLYRETELKNSYMTATPQTLINQYKQRMG